MQSVEMPCTMEKFVDHWVPYSSFKLIKIPFSLSMCGM
jgi:hypothetical protein